MAQYSFLLSMLVLTSLIYLGETTSLNQDQFICPGDSSAAFLSSVDKCRSENPDIDFIVVCVKNNMKSSYPNTIWSVFALKQITDLHFSAQIPCVKLDTRSDYGIVLTGYNLCQTDNTWKILAIVGGSLAGVLLIGLIVVLILKRKPNKKNPFLEEQ